jgi:hypothetical protein
MAGLRVITGGRVTVGGAFEQVLSRIVTLESPTTEPRFAVARSGLPSRLKSPAATD